MKRVFVGLLVSALVMGCPDGDEEGTGLGLGDTVGTTPDNGGEADIDVGDPDDHTGTTTGETPDGVEADGKKADGTLITEDAGPVDPCPGGFGCPCDGSDDCKSGYCVPGPGGGSICTEPCVEECPEDYLCKLLTGTTDTVYLCLPKQDKLCAPCASDAECGDLGGICLVDASGQGRCGKACDIDSPCPSGYGCEDVETAGGTFAQCVHESGECPCTELLLGNERLCENTNDFGTCKGSQLCTLNGWTDCDAAVAEVDICDGADNDCDGEADEDYDGLGEPCDVPDDADLCANGVVSCTEEGDDVFCSDDNPTDEQCDGIDNNCNFEVDEGFPDLDGDLEKDCVDEDDDGDGDLDATDCNPTDASIYAGATEVCDGVDQDCDGEADNGFGDLDGDGLADCVDDDKDGDGFPDVVDNCANVANPDQKNLDGDQLGDVCDPDDDNDGVADEVDLCPTVADPDQEDTDSDAIGDACDKDDDNDGSPDNVDCQPLNAAVYPTAPEVCDSVDNNCNQLVDEGYPDSDADLLANCLDPDDDNDLSLDEDDCEPLNKDVFPEQIEACDGKDNNCNGQVDEGFDDSDDDGVADCLDTDDDGDGVPDTLDNCPLVPNADQANSDSDNAGNACDTDDDGDGALDDNDCAPLNAAIHPAAVEVCDGIDNNCVDGVDEGFVDTDEDGDADCIDNDSDGDGVPDAFDNCPTVANPVQQNSDGDLIGDACDPDDDNDSSLDSDDCSPFDAKIFPGQVEVCDGLDNNCVDGVDEGFLDSNGDGTADCVSEDDDGDGFPDPVDNCPKVPNPGQENSDGDLIGDACDTDDDNDGSLDVDDCAPTNPLISPLLAEICDGVDNNCVDGIDEGFLDTNDDGQADCIDNDDDGDGLVDGFDNCPVDSNPGQENSDNDLIGDACDADDDNDGSLDADDCQPTNKAVHPGAEELCDAVDNNCVDGVDEGFADTDGDKTPDCLDEDDDGDGVVDGFDNCPLNANPGQENSDNDLSGDACDSDDDNDLSLDVDDCEPLNKDVHPGKAELCDGIDQNCNGTIDEGYPDTNNDGEADCVDFDDDGDGVVDGSDNCPLVANENQENSDSDLIGDACDDDDDNDGDPDVTDCAPKDPLVNASAEEVCDGVDNNCVDGADEGFANADGDSSADCVDPDDDNDGDPDVTDCEPLNAAVNNNAEEICGNETDDDCDPETTCFTVNQGDIEIDVVPEKGTEDVVPWYSYSQPSGASSNTGYSLKNRMVVYMYEDPTDGGIYIVFETDKPNDGSGGSTTVNISGGFGGSVVIMDDPGEGNPQLNPITGNGQLKWVWAPCCNDGAVIGPFTKPFCVKMTWSNVSGVSGVTTVSNGQHVHLGTMNQPLEMCANP